MFACLGECWYRYAWGDSGGAGYAPPMFSFHFLSAHVLAVSVYKIGFEKYAR